MIQSATPNSASGRLKIMPRMKPTVRLLVRNEATMPIDEHRQADEPVADVGADEQPDVGRAEAPAEHQVDGEHREQQRRRCKSPRAARYLPSTTSKSLAGSVSSSSSVPWRRSSAQMLIVIAGMNTSMMNGSHLLSWSRLARLLLKNSGGQNAASALSTTNTQMNTYPVGLEK